MAGGRVFSGGAAAPANVSDTSILLHNQPHDSSLFLSTSASFLGSRSMVSFADGKLGQTRSFFTAFDLDENGDEVMDEYFHQSEKKRRLSVDQVQFLEKSFEVDNKLEPDRKTKIAKELGLQPRQVAIWFQNRRARWKTKQLEKDYESLHSSYESLKSSYDNLLKEKDMLKAEVASLTEKVLARENIKQAESETKGLVEPPQRPLLDSVSEGEESKVSVGAACKHEDISSARSESLDSDSPRCYRDGVQHSAVLETCDSSYVLEPDQSDVSQDEEDNLTKTLLPPYVFSKLGDMDYSDPPESSCNFGFPEEDHALWSWSYQGC